MSAEPDFSQIHSYLIKTLPEILPDLLHQPEIMTTIEDIFARQYPRQSRN